MGREDEYRNNEMLPPSAGEVSNKRDNFSEPVWDHNNI